MHQPEKERPLGAEEDPARRFEQQILLARPLSLRVFFWISAFIISMLMAFLVWGEYTHKERVQGKLTYNAGSAKVYVQELGVVLNRFVNDGDIVSVGQPLYLISVERVSKTKGETRAAIAQQLALRKDSLITELRHTKSILRDEEAALRKKISDLENGLGQIEREIETQKSQVALTKKAVDRYSELIKRNFVSQTQLEEKERTNYEQLGKLHNLQRSAVEIQKDISVFKVDLQNMPRKTQNQLGQIERSIAQLEQDSVDNEAKREMVIAAPQQGRVTAILGEIGQVVSTQAPLLTILPQGTELEALLYVPSRAIGFVESGNRVLLRYLAFPFQKFGQYDGVVKEIARTALSPDELKIVGATPETLYQVRVGLDVQSVTAYGKTFPLQDGMQVDADVLLETRKLYEWVLDPIYSVTGRI